jgi:hypothetical protein
VRSYPEVPSSTFSIRPVAELDSVGIDVAIDDVLFNLVMKDTQLMRGSTPWREGREKDPVLLQLLIESTTQVGDIVLDCTASTSTYFHVILSFVALSFLIMTLCLHLSWFIEGASVHACRKAGRHFVAMEGDKEISKAILEPLIVDTITEGFKKQRLDGIDAAADVDLEELPDAIIKPLNQYCK